MTVSQITGQIIGHLDPYETDMLYDLARQVPHGGVIVEIGSYHGRSTVTLALGAKANGAHVYAIDCYAEDDEHMQTDDSDYGALLANLFTHEVADCVQVIIGWSLDVVQEWNKPIDLLFIDGSHVYEDVKADFEAWTPFVVGKVALHDTKPDGKWPGPVRVVQEAVDSGEWQIAHTANATTVLERCK